MTKGVTSEVSPTPQEGSQQSSSSNVSTTISLPKEWSLDWWRGLNIQRQEQMAAWLFQEVQNNGKEIKNLTQEVQNARASQNAMHVETRQLMVEKETAEKALSDFLNLFSQPPPSLATRKTEILNVAIQTIEARQLDSAPRISVELQVAPMDRVITLLDMIPSDSNNELHMESFTKAVKRAYPSFENQVLTPVWFSDELTAKFKKSNDKTAQLKNEWAQQQERYWFLALRIFQRLISIRCDNTFDVNRFDISLIDLGVLIHHFLAKFANIRRDLFVSAAYSKLAANQFKAQQYRVNAALSANTLAELRESHMVDVLSDQARNMLNGIVLGNNAPRPNRRHQRGGGRGGHGRIGGAMGRGGGRGYSQYSDFNNTPPPPNPSTVQRSGGNRRFSSTSTTSIRPSGAAAGSQQGAPGRG